MAKNTKTIELDGYKFTVDMDGFDDVRMFEMTDELEGRPKYYIDILKLGIGEEAYLEFEEYFKKKDGRLKMSTVMLACDRIMSETDPKEEASGPSESSTPTN